MAIVPVRLRDVPKAMDIFIVPNIRHILVLGVDFWVRMGIVPDMRKGEWYFSDVELNKPIVNSINSESDLSLNDLDKLNKIIDDFFSNTKNWVLQIWFNIK